MKKFLFLYLVVLIAAFAFFATHSHGQTLAGTLTIQKWTKMTGIINAALTADQNNYAPTGITDAAAVRLTADTARSITGLTPGLTPNGRIIYLVNVDTADAITLVSESASSTAANRFALGADVVLTPGGVGAVLIYDDTSHRWRSYSGSGTGSGGGGSGGTVTSVALDLPTSLFDVTGSPVTISGTLTGALKTQTANQVWAGPVSGAAASPVFRALVAADVPSLTLSKISDAGTMAAASTTNYYTKTATDTLLGSYLTTATAASTYLTISTAASTYQPLNTKLTAFAALANAAGWLHNDGAGVFAYTTPTKSDVGLGSVENTALSTWAGSANLTTLGTITTGVWNGTVVANSFLATALTGKTYNGLTLTSATVGFTIAGGTTSKTLTVSNTADVSGTNTGDQTSVTGNAGTATALQTARNINGVAFDGTANITVTAAAGTLTGTTLNSSVVTSSLTSLGTITTGVWNGTAIANANLANSAVTIGSTSVSLGGAAASISGLKLGSLTTNGFVKTSAGDGTLSVDTSTYLTTSSASSTYQPLDATLTSLAAYNTNGLLVQTAADTFAGRTVTGTASRISITNGNGVSGNPTIDIDSAYVGQSTITTLGTITTGTWSATTIAANKGGTGLASYTIGDLLYASSSSVLSARAAVATGSVLISQGTGTAPIWSSAPTVTTLTASGTITGDNLIGGVNGTHDTIVLNGATAGTGASVNANNSASTDYTPLVLRGNVVTIHSRTGVASASAVAAFATAGVTVTGGTFVSADSYFGTGATDGVHKLSVFGVIRSQDTSPGLNLYDTSPALKSQFYWDGTKTKIGSFANANLALFVNNTVIATISTSGLTVTGLTTTSNATVGSGVASNNATVIINGAATSSFGPNILWERNSVIKWQMGIESGIIGNNSDAFMLYDQAGGATALKYTSASGLAVTGSLSSTGTHTSTSTGGAMFTAQSSTTSQAYLRIQNTSGNVFLGIESSTGGAIITGSTAYDTVLTGASGIAFSGNGGTGMQARLTSTGLSVTGAVSCTTGFSIASVALTSGNYYMQVIGSSGADRTLILAGIASVSNGFVVGYTHSGTSMYYQMNGGGLTVGGTITNTQANGLYQIGGTTASFPALRNEGNTEASFVLATLGGYTSVRASAFNVSSDRRIKKNIRDYTGSGAVIDALRPRIFDIDTTVKMYADGKPNQIGFVAQELYDVFPQAVTKGDDGATIKFLWGVDTAKLMPVIVSELQSLRGRVTALEKNKKL